MIAARPAFITARAASARLAEPLALKAMGLAFVAVFSALFWMALIAAGGYALGLTISAKALVGLGTAIALFLTAVCAPLMLRA